MIPQQYEPLNFSEWLKRVFSFLNIAVFIFTISFAASELRFGWIENLVGSYLVSINELRPETGTVWKTGKQAVRAHEYLDQLVHKKENITKNARQASSFESLAAGLLPGEWVTLDQEEFKKLYLGIARSKAYELMDPVRLAWLLKGGVLDRIFCQGTSDGIKIYFIDSQNRVINDIELKKSDIAQLENKERSVPGRLADMPEFAGRIFPADIFFNAVFRLQPDILPDLMENPEILLDQDGKIIKVGIWNEADRGYIRLGFEFTSPRGNSVVFIRGMEWAVWQLSLRLKGEQ